MKKIVDYNFNRQEQNIEICDSHFAEAVQTAEAKKEKEKKSERRMPRLKGSGICKQELIRACLNGATHLVEDQVPT